MRKVLIFSAIAFQILALAYMAGNREYILKTGRTVYLRTAPVDPRDLFRGDYVSLNYAISEIPNSSIRKGPKDSLSKGNKIYVILKEDEDGLSVVDYATFEQPKQGVFIKGRIYGEPWAGSASSMVQVKYGIEAYFVQQGKAKDIENRKGRRGKVQIPMEMRVALGADGTAVIKGYRWSSLGIGLEVLRAPRGNQNDIRSPRVCITLENASDRSLGLINLPDFRSFFLVSANQWQKKWEMAWPLPEPPAPTDADVVIVRPGEQWSIEIDFADPRWHVTSEGQTMEIGEFQWSERFRLVYEPPGKEACRNLTYREQIWHGRLPTQAFYGRGNID